MPTTITTSPAGQTIRPTLVLGFETAIETRHITHEVLGTGAVDVTMRPAAPRSGTLRLLFETENAAATAFSLHFDANTFTLADTDRPLVVNMRYVPIGAVRLVLDDESRSLWTVEVPYQEVRS